MLANPRAVTQNVRFTESDLNRSFGDGFLGTYETERARELRRQAEAYDIVLDFHNTQTPNNNCGFVGLGCNPKLYEVAKSIGFSVCVEATYDCVNKYCPNTISIEISVDDVRDDPAFWYQKIVNLLRADLSPSDRTLQLYRFSRRVSWEEKEVYKLGDWKPFQCISEREAQDFGVAKNAVPIFIGSRFTSEFATLLTEELCV
jgi:hypothetical protein